MNFIEVIVVMVIIAILITIAPPPTIMTYNKKMEATNKKLEVIIIQITRFREIYGRYPVNQNEFEEFLLNKVFFEKPPRNPFYHGKAQEGWEYYPGPPPFVKAKNTVFYASVPELTLTIDDYYGLRYTQTEANWR